MEKLKINFLELKDTNQNPHPPEETCGNVSKRSVKCCDSMSIHNTGHNAYEHTLPVDASVASLQEVNPLRLRFRFAGVILTWFVEDDEDDVDEEDEDPTEACNQPRKFFGKSWFQKSNVELGVWSSEN